jgi:hypothetical protein
MVAVKKKKKWNSLFFRPLLYLRLARHFDRVMRVSEITQQLLVQSEEWSRRSEIAGPRFHDLLRIYQIQNMALADMLNASSSIAAYSTPSIAASLNMPREISIDNIENSNRSDQRDQDPDGDSSVDLLLIQTLRADTMSPILPIEFPKSPCMPARLLPPFHSSVESQAVSLPQIKTVSSVSQTKLIQTATTRNRTPKLRYGELGKRPRSTRDAVLRDSVLVSSLLLAAAEREVE